MKRYIELVEKLNWNNSLEIQQNAIKELSQKKDWDYRGVIINSDKGCWENLFKVFEIVKADDSLLLNDYIFLLKDLNWPGAIIALTKLKSLQKGVINDVLFSFIEKATNEKDEDWKENLFLVANYFKER